MRLSPPPISCKIYTPSYLADAIVGALGDEPGLSWLEPSHGAGAFIEALHRRGVPKKRIVAIDLDCSHHPADSFATTCRGVDFLRWARGKECRFDRVVGNPPFLGINRLPQSLQRSAAGVLDHQGRPIGRGANIWYAFVLTSIRLLKKGGSLAFVLPSAAEFADYSASIRNIIRDSFRSLELYRCDRPLFDNVQEGTIVAIARDYGSFSCKLRRTIFKTREDLVNGLSVSGYKNGHTCPSGNSQTRVPTVPLGSVANIRIGGVTGHASYFLMDDKKRISLGLPRNAVRPVVTKARHLYYPSISQADWKNLKASGQRIWLFRPWKKDIQNRNVKEYLEKPYKHGGCNRKGYKIRIRNPWYQTAMPERVHAFISGMGKAGPLLCINEMRGLSASNTIYVVTFKNHDRERWYMWGLSFLSSIVQRQLKRAGRRYAQGLVKYEPGTLSKIGVPRLIAGPNYKIQYKKAVAAFLSGDRKAARRIADGFIVQDANSRKPDLYAR